MSMSSKGPPLPALSFGTGIWTSRWLSLSKSVKCFKTAFCCLAVVSPPASPAFLAALFLPAAGGAAAWAGPPLVSGTRAQPGDLIEVEFGSTSTPGMIANPEAI